MWLNGMYNPTGWRVKNMLLFTSLLYFYVDPDSNSTQALVNTLAGRFTMVTFMPKILPQPPAPVLASAVASAVLNWNIPQEFASYNSSENKTDHKNKNNTTNNEPSQPPPAAAAASAVPTWNTPQEFASDNSSENTTDYKNDRNTTTNNNNNYLIHAQR